MVQWSSCWDGTMRKILWEPGGEAPNCDVFRKDSGKYTHERLCTSVCMHVHTHTHTHTIMLGGLDVPQINDST